MEMTSNFDVTNSTHQIQMTTIWPWTNPPPWKFSAYATVAHSHPPYSYYVLQRHIRTTIIRQQRPKHSINQPCSEPAKPDIKWVDKRIENRVEASCKLILLIQHPWYTIVYYLAKTAIA